MAIYLRNPQAKNNYQGWPKIMEDLSRYDQLLNKLEKAVEEKSTKRTKAISEAIDGTECPYLKGYIKSLYDS